MPVDVSFHPLDEAFVSKYYNRGMEDGLGVVDFDGPSKIVRHKQMIDFISDFFGRDAVERLQGKPNFNSDLVLFSRPYFLTIHDPGEVVNVLKLLDQSQSPSELFDIIHRQAEHVDFPFAEAKAQLKPTVIQQIAAMPAMGALQVQMYDWLDKKAYRYAMSRFVGFMSGMKVKKFRPKRMTAQEETYFKAELKRKPEEISVDLGTMVGHDIATIMSTMYPIWQSKGVGLTDLKAWADHLFPMIDSPHYLFTRLPTYNYLEHHIPKRVRAGVSGGCIRSNDVGQFIDAIKSGKPEVQKIFERVGHYPEFVTKLMDRLIEVGQYCLQRGFGILEAANVTPPY